MSAALSTRSVMLRALRASKPHRSRAAGRRFSVESALICPARGMVVTGPRMPCGSLTHGAVVGLDALQVLLDDPDGRDALALNGALDVGDGRLVDVERWRALRMTDNRADHEHREYGTRTATRYFPCSTENPSIRTSRPCPIRSPEMPTASTALLGWVATVWPFAMNVTVSRPTAIASSLVWLPCAVGF